MGSVQITGLSPHQPPHPEPSQQLGSAFPRIQQKKKKKGRERLVALGWWDRQGLWNHLG